MTRRGLEHCQSRIKFKRFQLLLDGWNDFKQTLSLQEMCQKCLACTFCAATNTNTNMNTKTYTNISTTKNAGGVSKMFGLHFVLGHDEHKRQILRLNHRSTGQLLTTASNKIWKQDSYWWFHLSDWGIQKYVPTVWQGMSSPLEKKEKSYL